MCSYIWHVWAASTRLNACKWCSAFVCVRARAPHKIQTSTRYFPIEPILGENQLYDAGGGRMWWLVFKFCIYFIRYAIFNAFNVCLCVCWSALGHGACGFASKCYTRYHIYLLWACNSLFKVFSLMWSFPSTSFSSFLLFTRIYMSAMYRVRHSFKVPTSICVTIYMNIYYFSFRFCCLHNWPNEKPPQNVYCHNEMSAKCTIQRAFHTCGVLKWLEWESELDFRPKTRLSTFECTVLCVRVCTSVCIWGRAKQTVCEIVLWQTCARCESNSIFCCAVVMRVLFTFLLSFNSLATRIQFCVDWHHQPDSI